MKKAKILDNSRKPGMQVEAEVATRVDGTQECMVRRLVASRLTTRSARGCYLLSPVHSVTHVSGFDRLRLAGGGFKPLRHIDNRILLILHIATIARSAPLAKRQDTDRTGQRTAFFLSHAYLSKRK